jgi:hypothetical protein
MSSEWMHSIAKADPPSSFNSWQCAPARCQEATVLQSGGGRDRTGSDKATTGTAHASQVVPAARV